MKIDSFSYALTETICYSGIFVSQEVTWVSEEVQVISHHGGSFPFPLIRDSSLSDLRMPWQDPQSFPWHIVDISSIPGMKRKNLSPSKHPGKFWKCSSPHFLSLKCSLPGLQWVENDIRQCKNSGQWALSFIALQYKYTASFLCLYGGQTVPWTIRSSSCYLVVESKKKTLYK